MSSIQKHYEEYLMIPTDDFIVLKILEKKSQVRTGNISDYVDELEDINSIDPRIGSESKSGFWISWRTLPKRKP